MNEVKLFSETLARIEHDLVTLCVQSDDLLNTICANCKKRSTCEAYCDKAWKIIEPLRTRVELLKQSIHYNILTR